LSPTPANIQISWSSEKDSLSPIFRLQNCVAVNDDVAFIFNRRNNEKLAVHSTSAFVSRRCMKRSCVNKNERFFAFCPAAKALVAIKTLFFWEINMRTAIIAVFLFLVGVTRGFCESYPTCDRLNLQGGEILYLSLKGKQNCWKKITGNNILRNDLRIKGGTYRFSYIFGDEEITNDFDPIFNVKIKELSSDSSIVNSKIGLYRAKLITNCKKQVGKKIAPGTNDLLAETDVSGLLYNDYHAGKRKDPGAKLSSFHIGFENSLKECVRTDDKNLRKSFEIDGIKFPAEPGFVASLIGTPPAVAAGKDSAKYKKISVQIGKGEFRGDYLTGSFFVPAGADFDVIASDLSTRLSGHFLRPPVKFRIRER
jgi:hypothetical protein